MDAPTTGPGVGKRTRVEEAGGGEGGGGGGGSEIVLPVAGVIPVAAARRPKLDVIGDGTAAHRGMTMPELEAYTIQQTDWFTDPSFTAADREAAWTVVNLLHHGAHVSGALANIRAGEIAKLPNREVLRAYFDCFDPAVETVQLERPAPNLARALQLGQAALDLATFVPAAVLRHVIPAYGFLYLVDNAKIHELRTYYLTFRPTLETPDEWNHVANLLDEMVATYASLVGWVSELHIFQKVTRRKLLDHVADRSRARPVLLVLMSALDWNSAFLQADNLAAAMTNAKNLTLVVQGRTLAAVTAQVSRVAREYGKGGKLGQVVLAGHGLDTSMEMASDSTQGWWDAENHRVAYDGQANLDITTEKSKDPKLSRDPKTNGTEALVDAILTNLDPATANLVFAGCLINSHDVSDQLPLGGGPAQIQKQLQANIAAHPNLADYVRGRMAATGHAAAISASNSSTVFDSFQVDATGHAALTSLEDPAVAGPKLAYVQTGIEPQGVMRAAIECCSDPAIGVLKTTAEMRKRVTALAGTKDWALMATRVGFELALPATGPADVARLVSLSHRIRTWGEYNSSTPAQRLADSLQPDEVKPLLTAYLTATVPDDEVAIHLAWTKFDGRHAAKMLAALTTTTMTAEDFAKVLSRPILAPHLPALLKVGAPSRGQMVLALTIADQDGAGMPAVVRTFLRAAAGGRVTAAFPAALDVDAILPKGAPRILDLIGLSARAPAGTGAVDGNVDLDHDGKNETRVEPQPRRASVETPALVVRDTPTSSGKELGVLAKGTILRVAGTVRAGTWSMIDHGGTVGFVASKYLSPP